MKTETQIKHLLRAQIEFSEIRKLGVDENTALEIQAIMAHIVMMIKRLESQAESSVDEETRKDLETAGALLEAVRQF